MRRERSFRVEGAVWARALWWGRRVASMKDQKVSREAEGVG